MPEPGRTPEMHFCTISEEACAAENVCQTGQRTRLLRLGMLTAGPSQKRSPHQTNSLRENKALAAELYGFRRGKMPPCLRPASGIYISGLVPAPATHRKVAPIRDIVTNHRSGPQYHWRHAHRRTAASIH